MIESTFPVSRWPRAAPSSQRDALDRAYTQLYPDLCRIARTRLRSREQRGLDSHSLVHESFLRLVGASAPPLANKQHFCAYAAKTMQNIAIDVAREQGAGRRGGDTSMVILDVDSDGSMPETRAAHERADTQQRIHDALLALESVEPALAALVRMRYFDGYSQREIAERTGLARRTVRRHWERARALLQALLQD
jgi:RNA polymerase sigma factor (TIGR02999 family)